MAFRLPLEVQLDVDASAGDFGELAYEWLDGVSLELRPDVREALAGLPARVSRSTTRFGPLGESGSQFGLVSVSRQQSMGPAKTAERNCSSAGMLWLRRELTDLPAQADLWFGELDGRGHRSGRLLTLQVEHVEESAGWLRLLAHLDEEDFLDPDASVGNQRRWLRVLFSFADRLDPGFGHVSYVYGKGGTALEDALRPSRYPREWRDHVFTVNDCRRYLRGYSWLTIVPKELAGAVGGVAGLRASGAFSEVRELRAGGVWLLATEDYRDFSDEALGRVFTALAPILRPGEPTQMRRTDGQPPQRLIFRDAAEVSASGRHE
jgi:hypothetical protein